MKGGVGGEGFGIGEGAQHTRLSFIAIVALFDNKTFAADLLPW